MNITAFLLVISGAICHAIWNITAKKSSSGGLVFVWLFGNVSVVAILPVAAWAWAHEPQVFNGWMWLATLSSGLVHTGYSLVLQKAYRESDFAVVYPIARGSGPMFSVTAAILLLGETPSLAGGFSVAAILVGLFVSAGAINLLRARDSRGTDSRRAGVIWGLTTGVFIATYTLIDGWAIKSLGMTPILFYAISLASRTVLLAPFALRQRQDFAEQWKTRWRASLIIGLLSPIAYLLVLMAVQQAPVSYVAPVREISMLIGTFVGASLLREAVRPFQVIGASIMLFGVIGLIWA